MSDGTATTAWQVDHVFAWCAVGAPELALLERAGLAVGVRREHRGQGTANACIGFADGYLELLWLADDAAARDPHVRPLGLSERARWRETGASPFGIALRPRTTPATSLPFVAWDYRPAYLPPDLTIHMACNSGVLGEPLLFAIDRPFAPFGVRHRFADARLRRATVTVVDLAPVSLLRDVAVAGLLLREGAEPLLELELGGGGGGGAVGSAPIDLRPHLPLVLRG